MSRRKTQNLLLGALLIFIAATAYAFMGALVKFGGKVSDEQLVFMRNAVCLIIILPWVLNKPLKTKVFPRHLFRAAAGLLNMYCFFYAIRYIRLTDAMVLNNTMPLFIPFVLWIWKKQKIRLKLVPGLVIGFVGILLILRPGLGIFRAPAAIALASGLFMSLSMVGVRNLGKHDPTYRILFYYFAIATLISAFPLAWGWSNHPWTIWVLLVGIGLFALLYQLFLTMGYEYASPQKVSPLIYFAVVLSAFLDWIFWHDKPSALSYIGAILVIVGAIYSMRVQRT